MHVKCILADIVDATIKRKTRHEAKRKTVNADTRLHPDLWLSRTVGGRNRSRERYTQRPGPTSTRGPVKAAESAKSTKQVKTELQMHAESGTMPTIRGTECRPTA